MPADRDAALLPDTFGALGVVFGDLATSPLYSLQTAFGEHGVKATPGNVLGLLSLVLWSLLLVVTGKYVFVVMRADNDGEGGMLALAALARRAARKGSRWRWWLVMLGIAGAALFFGDSVITPAISVLSAVEGLHLATPTLDHSMLLAIAALILAALFVLQRRGSTLAGKLFGPVMTLWLLTVAALGAWALARAPRALAAIDPLQAIAYLHRNGFRGFASLGAVVLVMTGAEALYADIGHFGKRPIRLAWLALVLPALLLNYFGQGAFLLGEPAAAVRPFYMMVPHALLYPAIALATAATVIASQAVISGTFSMIRQGIQIGYLPRGRVVHTSPEIEGQVYLPFVNWLLFAAVMAAVLGFRSSQNLSGAFGIAVSGTMLVTSVLVLVVAQRDWHWGLLRLGAFGVVFVSIDAAFFSANLLKAAHGGWYPLLLAAGMLLVMTVWRRGRELLLGQMYVRDRRLDAFIGEMLADPPLRTGGAAVFLAGDPQWVPLALLRNVEHNGVLHRRNVILTVDALDAPRAPPRERCEVEDLGHGFQRVRLRFGFAEDVDVPARLGSAGVQPPLDIANLTWFVGHQKVADGGGKRMLRWRARLFACMLRNALPATTYFRIPPERLIEIGGKVEM